MDLIVNNGIHEEILTGFDTASFTEEWTKNSTWSISFKVTKKNKNAFTFDLIQHESLILYDGQWFVIKQLEPNANGNILTKSITANHIYFTCQDHRQYEQKTKTWTIEEALEWTFKGNVLGFTWEVVGTFKKVEIENFGDANALNMVTDILSKFNAVIDADNKHLIFYAADSWGQITHNQFRYLYNTDTVNCRIDTTNLKTVIRGYGKQKEDGSYYFPYVTYKSPNIEIWGERHADPIKDERYTKSEEMLAYLKTQIQDEPSISLSITVKKKEEIKKGDHWLLIYEPLNFDTSVEVIGYRKYPFVRRAPEVTFSNDAKDMVGILSSFATLGKTINKVVDGSGKVKVEALGTLPESKVAVGSGTKFAPGYDPTKIQIPSYSVATETTDGLMSSSDKQKLNLIVTDSQGHVIVNIPLVDYTKNGLMSSHDKKKLDQIITDENGNVVVNIPLVSMNNNGLMSKEDYALLLNLEERINAIENGGGTNG